MKTIAAILVETGKPLVLAEIEIPRLKPGQTLIEIAFSGVCHTQLLECRGHRGEDKFLPHCLGHEGSGVVLETGEGVTKVRPGDHVILSWIKGSGADIPGTVYDWDGRKVNSGAITTFSRHSVISENRLTVLPDNVPVKESVLLGCAAPTGIGAVLNTAAARRGQSAAIFGVGGVGLCAVAGAVVAGCAPIIAVDIHEGKLELASKMGATHCINPANENPVEAVRRICPGGADIAVEVTGRPGVMAQALESVRNQGGAAVIVGNAHHGESIALDPRQLNMGKRLLGTWGGDSVPDDDYPKYCEMIASGKLNLSPLLSNTYSLNNINEALDDLEAGKAIRPLIDMSLE